MNKVYLVMGECGDYEDHKTWPVKAFLSYDASLKYVAKAQSMADELYSKYIDSDWTGEASEFDAGCDGTEEIIYWEREIPFDESDG